MSIRVKDIMTRDVKTARSDDTILRTAEVMNKYEIGCVVVTEDEKPVGVVTERDILKRVVYKRMDPAETRLAEVMSKPLVTVNANTTITKAARIMVKQKVKKLPVIKADRLIGILSLTDLAPLLKHQRATNNLWIKEAPKCMKRILEGYIDPETKQRKKCPLIIMGGAPIGCLASKCMWFDTNDCVFRTFVYELTQRRRS